MGSFYPAYIIITQPEFREVKEVSKQHWRFDQIERKTELKKICHIGTRIHVR